MINWPAVIKFEGEDEMTYVSSQSEWDTDPDLHYFSYQPEDMLVDSSGKLFGLAERRVNFVHPKSLDKSLTLLELTKLVRKHASSKGECCVLKISFNSISDAISAIEELR